METYRRFLLPALLALLSLTTAAPAYGSPSEGAGGETKAGESGSSEQDSDQKKADAPARPLPKFGAGVFFGHVLYIDPAGAFVYVQPIDRSLRRKHFYLDRSTLVTYSEEGKRTDKKIADLIEGQRVAIRFFVRDDLALADEVFVVFDEFLQPQAYNKRARKSFSPEEGLTTEEFKERMQKKAGKSEDDEEKEEKPAPKKSGGGGH